MKKHIDYLLNVVGPKSGGGGGGYPEPTGSITIRDDGTYNVKDYAEADVRVKPEFPIVMQITENGNYDVTDYTGAEVNVAGPSGSTTITENGTYDVTDKAEAVVNVAGQDKSIDIIDRSVKSYEYNQYTSIGEYAFYRCQGLTSVSFSLARFVKRNAFYQCTALSNVNLPTVEEIDTYAFYQCTALQTISLPTCTRIGEYTFMGCGALTSFSAPLLTRVEGHAFDSCPQLSNVYAPNISTIQNYAFKSCTGLQSIVLDKTVSIPQYCFNLCSNLETVDFGAQYSGSATGAIQAQAFYSCNKLSALIIRHNTVHSLNNANAFTNTPIASGTGYIYVPASLVASYQAATNWSTYSAQFRALEDYTVDGTTTGALDPTKI